MSKEHQEWEKYIKKNRQEQEGTFEKEWEEHIKFERRIWVENFEKDWERHIKINRQEHEESFEKKWEEHLKTKRQIWVESFEKKWEEHLKKENGEREKVQEDINTIPIKNAELEYIKEDILFDVARPYSYIQKKHYDNLNEIIKITDCKLSNSSSKSFIFEGKLVLGNIDVFCKFFPVSNDVLLYEKNIYNFINQFIEENKNLKETIIQHIVIPVDIIYTKKVNFPTKLSGLYLCDFNSIKNDTMLCGIITQKHENFSTFNNKLRSLFKLDLDTLTTIKIDGVDVEINMNQYNTIKIIFSALYSIYLLHMKLDVMHNDNHFGNILYYDTPEFDKVYKLGDQEIKSRENFTTRIYDFDQSSKIQQHSKHNKLDNPYLDKAFCKSHGSCNHHSQKDVFVLIASLVNIYTNPVSYVHPFLEEMVECLIDNKLLDVIIAVQEKSIHHFWSSYLKMNDMNDNFIVNSGDIASYPEIEITDVLNRFIKKYTANNLLLIRVDDTNYMKFNDIELKPINDIIYKKYLKYKKKYLNLKKHI